jgi:chloramphenicol O-acetyltransferase type A
LKRKIDIEGWNRKAHFHFFKDFDNPFYNICCNIDITDLLNACKYNNRSFFLASLYLSTKAANCVSELKFRLEEEEVFEYETIHPFSTIMNDDKTFSFCEFKMLESYIDFERNGKLSIAETMKRIGLFPKEERTDVIHFTTVPWIEFTSVSHARE